jgi:hypothetical protein
MASKRSAPKAASRKGASQRPGTPSEADARDLRIDARALPLSDVRSRLSPLLRELRPTSKPVGVTVHGKVKGYLVSPEQLQRMLGHARQEARAERRKPSMRGSMKLLRPLDEAEAEARRELDEALQRSAVELLRG